VNSSISVVIVNWNAGAQLQECLDSFATAVGGLRPGQILDQVVVVDNASRDGSADALSLPSGSLKVMRNERNRGFAAACNQGAAGLRSDLVLFLNPDTRLFANSLSVPMAFLADPAHSGVGIVGVQLLDETGTIARSCSRFPRPSQFASQVMGLDRVVPQTGHAMREWDHLETRDVDQVIGAFFLVRRAVFESLAGFDERFFVYFEEIDLAARARQAGHRSVFLAEAQAWHRGGGTTDQVKGIRLFYSLRSRLLYSRKHFSTFDRLVMSAVTWILEPISRCAFLAAQGRFAEIGHVAEAYRLLLRHRNTEAAAS
jgi:hypothetical protein